MFAKACEDLLPIISPIIVAMRQRRGKIDWTGGAGMFLNRQGWFVTAGHILEEVARLENEIQVNRNKKKRKKGTDITEYTFTVGQLSGTGLEAKVSRPIDLGLGRLIGVQLPKGHRFPKFRTNPVKQGELLCRAGFPFVENLNPKLSWKVGSGFDLSQMFPLPMFVNEALVSRFANVEVDGTPTGTWIETSSPGLRGQSGGPLFDVDGNICGIQVNTMHYPLGFKGKGRNQSLHVGRAVHSETIRSILEQNNVSYCLEES